MLSREHLIAILTAIVAPIALIAAIALVVAL